MSNENQNEPSQGSIVTGTVKLTQSRFTWDLAQDSLEDVFKYEFGLTSPELTTRIDDIVVQWRLSLRPKKTNTEEYICICAKCVSHNNLKINLKITAVNNSSNTVTVERSNMEFTLNTWYIFIQMHKQNLIDQRTNNNKCTIVCSITTTSPHSHLLSKIDCYNPYKKIVNSKQFSDVVLCVEGKELYAYKGILASRSSVFMAMFSHNTTELNSSRVEITDVSYDTMYNVLHYMYTDWIPQFPYGESQEKCKNLLIAADKYDLQILKIKMTENLASTIQTHNVFEYLSFADLYNAPLLKNRAIEFIISHNDEIVNSDSYKNFSSLHPDLSCEVFRCVLAKRRRLT